MPLGTVLVLLLIAFVLGAYGGVRLKVWADRKGLL